MLIIFEDPQKVNLFENVKWLISILIIPFLAFIWTKYFRIRPKVRVSVKWGGSTNYPKDNGAFEFRYTPKLVLHNDSNFVARRISIIQSTDISHWCFRGQLPDKIESDGRYEWEFDIQSVVSHQKLVTLFGETIADTSPSQEYFSYALGNTTLIVSYDNEKDKTFYTLFNFVNGESKSEFRWRKPKIK